MGKRDSEENFLLSLLSDIKNGMWGSKEDYHFLFKNKTDFPNFE